MSKHTPGKWEISREVKTAINSGDKHIAMINFYKCGNPNYDVYGAEHEANARLIANAPRMLEGLISAEKILCKLSSRKASEEAMNLRNDIAAATGDD